VIFPAICPICRSDSGRRVIPESPEVCTFRCGSCDYQWSERAPGSDYAAKPRLVPSLDQRFSEVFPTDVSVPSSR